MGVDAAERKKAASTMTLMPPHQHCVTKPANAAARYCSSSVNRALKTATYGRSTADTSALDRVQRVESRDDFLDRWLLEVHIFHLELGRDVRDEPVRRGDTRIERQLHRPPLSLANPHAGVGDVVHVAREVNPKPAFRQGPLAKTTEAA